MKGLSKKIYNFYLFIGKYMHNIKQFMSDIKGFFETLIILVTKKDDKKILNLDKIESDNNRLLIIETLSDDEKKFNVWIN